VKNTRILQVGVKSLIYKKNKGFLLLRRNPSKYLGKVDLWDVPGGRIETSASLLRNLAREVKEETGISEVSREKMLGAQDILWTNFEGKNVHLVRLTYISHVTSDKVKLSDEHTEYKWASIADLAKTKDLDAYLKQLLKDKAIMSFIKDYCDRE
jgi:8-oxo-dGTP diphosphatase